MNFRIQLASELSLIRVQHDRNVGESNLFLSHVVGRSEPERPTRCEEATHPRQHRVDPASSLVNHRCHFVKAIGAKPAGQKGFGAQETVAVPAAAASVDVREYDPTLTTIRERRGSSYHGDARHGPAHTQPL